jgi:hypothetical protein
VVLRGADRANRRRQGLPEPKAAAPADDQWAGAEPPRFFAQPEPPDTAPADQEAADPAPAGRTPWPGNGVSE